LFFQNVLYVLQLKPTFSVIASNAAIWQRQRQRFMVVLFKLVTSYNFVLLSLSDCGIHRNDRSF